MSAIDPGVDGDIKETADHVDPNDAERDLEREEREDFTVPNRWWLAAVAFPLLAGTLGPIATGFNIMALSQYWRRTIPPNGHAFEGHLLKDPHWLVAVNALSLFSALVGNASLLLNMARRIKFAIAQPLTIAGFMLAGLLLIADIAALTASSDYHITQVEYQPGRRHGLTMAFYYAIFAAILYTGIAFLMCATVYGALRGEYDKQFHLTLSQRSLMLQTMSFMTYLLLGGLVFSYVEKWDFLNAVYWADVTILTVGMGDYYPITNVGRGLLFPFAIGGVLILGLVIGSIRSLVLDRGRQKMSARMLEKRRAMAVNNVDSQKETVRISMFARANFLIDPNMCAAQRREQEFGIMRKVQEASDTERRYMALANSSAFALGLWFLGALVFTRTEEGQGWSYFHALYFSYTSLMTIGYGDFTPTSSSGKAFFVFWSLLAVPSLTILISNLGDTIVKWVETMTDWVSRLTVLPGEGGFRSSIKQAASDVVNWFSHFFDHFSGPGVFGLSSTQEDKGQGDEAYENGMLDTLAERLDRHVDDDERDQNHSVTSEEERQEKDIQFYHYVLARECRNLHKDISATPAKQYSWADWEYYLKLIGDEADPWDYPGQKHPDIMVPDALRAPDGLRSSSPQGKDTGEVSSGTEGTNEEESTGSSGATDGNVDQQQAAEAGLDAKRKQSLKRGSKDSNEQSGVHQNWSWLSGESPLLSNKSEAEWILERLSAALERELNRQRKGYRTKPPITLMDARRSAAQVHEKNGAARDAADEQQQNLEKAAEGKE